MKLFIFETQEGRNVVTTQWTYAEAVERAKRLCSRATNLILINVIHLKGRSEYV